LYCQIRIWLPTWLRLTLADQAQGLDETLLSEEASILGVNDCPYLPKHVLRKFGPHKEVETFFSGDDASVIFVCRLLEDLAKEALLLRGEIELRLIV